MGENQKYITSREALENIAEGDYLVHDGKVVVYSGIEDRNPNFIFRTKQGIFRYNLPEENISFGRNGQALFKKNQDFSFDWLPDYKIVDDEERRLVNLLSQAGF